MIEDRVMPCKKKAFSSLDEARARATEINVDNRINKVSNPELRPYKCEVCHMYHLTKMQKEKHEVIRKAKEKREERRFNNFLKE